MLCGTDDYFSVHFLLSQIEFYEDVWRMIWNILLRPNHLYVGYQIGHAMRRHDVWLAFVADNGYKSITPSDKDD